MHYGQMVTKIKTTKYTMPFRSDDLICPDCHTALQCNVKDGQGTLACLAGHTVSPSLEDGYRSLAVIEAAEESAKTQHVVSPSNFVEQGVTGYG